MTAQDVTAANNALLDAAVRLVDETAGIPAGSVLRCFSRAVHVARSTGCPISTLPIEADQLARVWLATRLLGR